MRSVSVLNFTVIHSCPMRWSSLLNPHRQSMATALSLSHFVGRKTTQRGAVLAAIKTEHLNMGFLGAESVITNHFKYVNICWLPLWKIKTLLHLGCFFSIFIFTLWNFHACIQCILVTSTTYSIPSLLYISLPTSCPAFYNLLCPVTLPICTWA